MAAQYSITSPYYLTPIVNDRLQQLIIRTVPAQDDDILYQIDDFYNLRPDLLANDQYQSPRLWWIFAHRNPNILKDPIWDFQKGKIIYLPSFTKIKTLLGI